MADTCIYTIRHPDELARAVDSAGLIVWSEGRPWVTAKKLLANARREGQRVPILFGDATDCLSLTHWGILTGVRIRGNETNYRFHSVRRLPGGHSPQQLTLCSTGEKIAYAFIRPYAICKTPSFIR